MEWTINALVNSVKRRIMAAAATGRGGGTRNIDHCSYFSFPALGVPTYELEYLVSC